MSSAAVYADQERRYGRRWTIARAASAAVTWTAAGAMLGTAVRAFLLLAGNGSPWAAVPVALLPPIAAAAAAALRSLSTKDAVVWLDKAVSGKQQLLAAHEARTAEEGTGRSGRKQPMENLVLAEGRRIFESFRGRPPLPSPATAMGLTAVVAAAIFCLAIIMGDSLLGPPDPETVQRGEDLEEWSEAWAERSGEEAFSENRELAGRMGDIGRRMADGSMGQRRSEKALTRLESEILERRDGLIRDKLAESLVEDLGVNEETADAFRVQHRRLPADALADLGRAARDSGVLSDVEEQMIESLLSDPAFRDRRGDGTQELSERLAEALEDALDPGDTGLDSFDEAVEKSRRARGEEEAVSPDGRAGNGDGGERAGGRSRGSEGERGLGSEGDSGEGADEGNGAAGGSGRGSNPVADEFGASRADSPDFGKESLRLPSETDRTGSWRTVIRAYAEDEGGEPVPDAEIREMWRREAEAAIRREDIPPGTREFVKDYFTALEGASSEPNREER